MGRVIIRKGKSKAPVVPGKGRRFFVVKEGEPHIVRIFMVSDGFIQRGEAEEEVLLLELIPNPFVSGAK